MSSEGAVITLGDFNRLGEQIGLVGRDLGGKIDALAEKVSAGDVERGQLVVKVGALEREMWRRKNDRGEAPPAPPRVKGITERDVRIFAIGAGIVLAGLRGLPWLAAVLRALVATAP